MSRPPANRSSTKDMYWFAHGGIEVNSDKYLNQKGPENEEENSESNSPMPRSTTVIDSCSSSGPSSLETKDLQRGFEKHIAAEERRKHLLEAEQERNEAVLKKHLEREAALEARRNAQRTSISFAFGSSIPRNIESLQAGNSDSEKAKSAVSVGSGFTLKEENHNTEHSSVSPISSRPEVADGCNTYSCPSNSNFNDAQTFFPPICWLVGSGALVGEDLMSKSMTAAVPAARGRRKNDLTPVVHYERLPTSDPQQKTRSTLMRKRSVSMTRLDQLAQPRKHYVEANKAGSTHGNSASGMPKENKSPKRPLSSASEQSGGSGRVTNSAPRRIHSSPRKPRPISIAGTVPDHKFDPKVSPIKKVPTTKKTVETKKAISVSKTSSKLAEKKISEKKTPPSSKPAKPTMSTPKPVRQPPPQPKSTSSPKTLPLKKSVTNKAKTDLMALSQEHSEAAPALPQEALSPSESPTPDGTEAESNAKRIISEEEAKMALAEKRRLVREQAEKEAALERQRQEELERHEEERLRLEEEEQKRMEEEQLRLLEEHRRLEEEKLRKAIEENERREEEERIKREEEQRLKAEQEKKSLEEAEKQRVELEEKLRKEEEERAERKKRLEKIMSRTRGKKSPSGSISGSDQLDSSENQHDNLSSGANSLDSNGQAECPASLEGPHEKSELISDGASMEAHPTYEVASDNESLHDIVMPKSETASQDNSLIILPEKEGIKASVFESLVESLVDDMPGSEPFHNEVVDTATLTTADEKEHVSDVAQSDEKVSSEIESVTEKVEVQDFVYKSDISHLDAAPILAESAESKIIDHSDIILDINDTRNNGTEHSISNTSSEQVLAEGKNLHFSSSSDIKLPDPIYETTSEEGSLSSEKQNDGGNFAFPEENHHESQIMPDDVFNEKEITYSVSSNPFDKQVAHPNPMAAYESQFEIGGMQDSFYDYETSSSQLPDVMDQPHEFIDEKDNTDISSENAKHMEDIIPSQQTYPFSETDSFVGNFQENDSQVLVNNLLQHEISATNEQTNSQSEQLTDDFDSSNVTIIKSTDNNDCIGIISSIDHDQISNDLVNQQKFQLKSNLDYGVVTDSEDSSLDSNLSQVMTAENDSAVVNLNNGSSSSPVNGQAANPFFVNGTSDSKSNGEHFYSETDTLKNGHRLECTELKHENGLDSNLISSVDKSNIFENVDAVPFGKMSSDPFLAKEIIPGNPFHHLQEDGKPVLMTPDFFN